MNAKINLDFLPFETRELFEKFSRFPFFRKFVLVGGTGLCLQAAHRQSEDLDFISISENLNVSSIKRFFSSNFNNYRIVRIDENFQIDLVVNGVKVTFFSKKAVGVTFDVTMGVSTVNKVSIASVETIAILKINAISQRNTMRDYYDLYYLAKHFIELRSIIEISKKNLPYLSPVVYSETLLFVKDIPENSISSHLSPKESVSKYEIAEFFQNELKNYPDKI
ncbi:hypothetical protein MASR1M107_09220 [Ignavibacteriales bacterium]